MGRVLTSTSLAAAAFVATSLAAAHAADLGPMVTKAPPPVPVYYNWTGFYIGVNLGGSWGHETDTIFDDHVVAPFFPITGGFNDHPNGVIGGGQIGYNWQFAPWFGWGNGTVLGIEADIQGSSQRDDRNFGFLVAPCAAVVCGVDGDINDKLRWFGTVRGRIGIAFDRWLPYVTGGWAYGDREFDGTITALGPTGLPLATAAFSGNSSTSTNGWTVGGGVEWAFWDHWTAKLEYLYIDFGNRDNNNNNNNFVVFPTVPLTTAGFTTGHLTDNIVRAGVNWKF